MSRISITTILAMLAFFIFCSYLSADVIHLKDGRKVEGVIVTKDGDKVSIKTKFGIVEFPMTDVLKIEEKKTVDQLYKEKLANANPRDTGELMELAEWCSENKLISKAKKHLKQIISLDTNHEVAREKLGYVKYEGKWVTKRTLDKLKREAEIAAKKDAGLVEYKGEWLPKEDVEKLKEGFVKYKDKWVTQIQKERLEKNLVEYEGEWLPAEDVEKRKQGLFKINGTWVTKKEADREHSSWENPWRLHSEHVTMMSNIPHDQTQKFLAECEGTYKNAQKILGLEPDLTAGKLVIYLAVDMETYNIIGANLGADEKSSNYAVYCLEESQEAVPVSVTYLVNESFTMGLVRHAVVEQFFKRMKVRDALPDWFIKGQAAKLERFFHPKYVSWSKGSLIKQGGPVKLKQFFDGFNYTEREILHAGLVCSYLDSDDLPSSIGERFDEVKEAVKIGKKIEVAFAKLETLLIKAEKNFLVYVDKF